MEKVKSIRTFIGAKHYDVSRQFYLEFGFLEHQISRNMSLFRLDATSFYLQDYYVKKWVDNTMVFLEVDNLDRFWDELKHKELDKKFPGVKYVDPKKLDWGREGFVHDPSGVLWHIGQFND